jgi:transposase-like protein
MARSPAKSNFAIAVCLCPNLICIAQNAPADQKPADQAAYPDTAALPSPPITGPLRGLFPFTFDGGPLGKVAVNGILSGIGLWQGNHVTGNLPMHMNLSNGQVYIEKPEGWFQFYLQAGAYTTPALATPFFAADKTMTNFFGPLPIGYVKLVPDKNTSIQIGALPTLIGAEYTFTFENMNIERGLLWNQENAVNPIAGRWTYLYRAVDSTGATIDFLLSETRDLTAARSFFQKALAMPAHPRPRVINVDGNPAYPVVEDLKSSRALGQRCRSRVVIPYLNNIVEQDHRAIKRRVNATSDFVPFDGAQRTIQGCEAMHMIRKGQVRWLKKCDVNAHARFIRLTFGLAD